MPNDAFTLSALIVARAMVVCVLLIAVTAFCMLNLTIAAFLVDKMQQSISQEKKDENGVHSNNRSLLEKGLDVLTFILLCWMFTYVLKHIAPVADRFASAILFA